MPVLRKETVDGLPCLVLESEHIVCKFLPDLGGKMIALTDKRSGREWIKPKRQVTYIKIGYGANYGDFDRTGFDECFPDIAEAKYPYEPWKCATIPDHGEIWTIPWNWEKADKGLRMWVHGVRFPYVFHKDIALDGEQLVIGYKVENPTPCEMPCMWSSHPIFEIEEGMRVLIPRPEKVIIDYSKNDRLGDYLDELDWPITRDASGAEVDLSTFGPKSNGTADKIFACHVSDGYAALHEPISGDYVGFTFDTREVPHVGLWSNIGGWPENEPDYNCALEPCSGYPDKLGMGEHQIVPSNGELRWKLCLRLGRADAEDAVRRTLHQT
ncbi:MAG: aldose epimerase family protein [Armatimonadota bacterium]